jgi:hypothetical protein
MRQSVSPAAHGELKQATVASSAQEYKKFGRGLFPITHTFQGYNSASGMPVAKIGNTACSHSENESKTHIVAVPLGEGGSPEVVEKVNVNAFAHIGLMVIEDQ